MDLSPGHLTDEQLVAYVERLSDRADREALGVALDELFRRIREEAAVEERDDVERAIARLRRIFTADDGDDGPDSLGVREPRRPSPQSGSAGAAA